MAKVAVKHKGFIANSSVGQTQAQEMVSDTQPGELSRRSLAAKFLAIPEESILASRDLKDGGILVVLVSGPKLSISAKKLEGIERSASGD